VPYTFAEGRGLGKGKVPPDFSRGQKKGWEGGRPPGWTKGEKEGWHTILPPGLERKASRREREAFLEELGAAGDVVRKNARGEGLANEAIEDILVSLNLAAMNGARISEIADVVGEWWTTARIPTTLGEPPRPWHTGLAKV